MKKAGVNMAKNKVKVEYDVDMEKERRKKQQKTSERHPLPFRGFIDSLSAAFLHAPFNIPLRFLFGQSLPFVIQLLPCRQGDRRFDLALFEI